MNKQEQDYNAGYRQAIADIEELLYDSSHKYSTDADMSLCGAIDIAEYANLEQYSREYKDGYHDALQKLYNIFKIEASRCNSAEECGYKQALKDIAQSESDSIMIRNTEVLNGSIVMDCFQLVPCRIEFAQANSISARDIEIFAKAFDLKVAATEEEADGDFTTMTVSVATALIDEDTDAYTGRVFKVQE